MKILIVDIETTGFLNTGGKIVEIGAVSLDLETGATEIVFDKLLREPGLTKKDKDAWIFKNSSLTTPEVRDAEPSEKVFAEFQEILNQYPAGATAFNRVFDFNFLLNRGLQAPKLLPCPMLLATNVCKLPGRFGKYKWPKVEEAWQHFFPEIPYVEEHRGADDAVHEAKIVFELYKMGIFNVC